MPHSWPNLAGLDMAAEKLDERALEAQVEQTLRDAKLSYRRDVVIGDACPDFVVTTENGDQIVVEVNAWEPTPEATARALNQVRRFRELSKTGAAVLVTPAVAESIASAAVAVTPVGGV